MNGCALSLSLATKAKKKAHFRIDALGAVAQGTFCAASLDFAFFSPLRFSRLLLRLETSAQWRAKKREGEKRKKPKGIMMPARATAGRELARLLLLRARESRVKYQTPLLPPLVLLGVERRARRTVRGEEYLGATVIKIARAIIILKPAFLDLRTVGTLHARTPENERDARGRAR